MAQNWQIVRAKEAQVELLLSMYNNLVSLIVVFVFGFDFFCM